MSSFICFVKELSIPTNTNTDILNICSKYNYSTKFINDENKIIIKTNAKTELSKFIYDINSHKVIAIYNKTVKRYNNEKLTGYTIYEMTDSSIIQLYFHSDKWVIATKKSSDMNNYLWGNKTYKEMLDELFEMFNIHYDYLDKSFTYSLLVTHKNIHPFCFPNNEIYFLCRSKINEYGKLIREYTDSNIRSQKVIQPKLIESLLTIADTSYCEYLTNSKKLMGYVLRNDDNPTEPIYIIESSLYTFIKEISYNYRIKDCFSKFSNKLNNSNRLYCYIINLFVKFCNDRETFSQFYNFRVYDKLKENIVEEYNKKSDFYYAILHGNLKLGLDQQILIGDSLNNLIVKSNVYFNIFKFQNKIIHK